ncbi:MAG TPA: VWA domain-containing protein [Vicinamibacterales bacterium]|jgi:Ca-activated chloride channel family protein
MTRRLAGPLAGLLGLCCLWSTPSAATQSAAPQQPSTFRGSSELVRVFATVLDKDGRLVTTLTKDQFELRDDGKPQPLTLFDNTPQPIKLIEMLDVSGSMEGNLPILREASDALFTRLRPDDLVRVGAFGHEVKISEPFTNDIRDLRAFVPRYIAPDAPTPLWHALEEAIAGFGKEQDERRAILVMTDGKDTGAIGIGGFGRHVPSQGGVIDRARDADTMIYAVGMRSRQRPHGQTDMRAMMLDDLPDPGLAKVAEETGGGYLEIHGGEDLSSAFAHVADELHGQYLLGYVPPKRDGKVHSIDVRVTDKSLKPRARKNYVAPK